MKPISNRPKIEVGDLVAHLQSKNKGLVTVIKGDLIKFKVFGPTGPKGEEIFRVFKRDKLVIMAKSGQIEAKYKEIVAAKEAAAKRDKNPLNRLARWVGSKLPFRAVKDPKPA
jgi:hypothetical protein